MPRRKLSEGEKTSVEIVQRTPFTSDAVMLHDATIFNTCRQPANDAQDDTVFCPAFLKF